MKFDFNSLDGKSKIIFVSGICGILSVFIPWVNVLKVNVSAWQTFELYGNSQVLLGIIGCAATIFFLVKNQFSFAFYASMIPLVLSLNWYFIWFGSFNVEHTAESLAYWRSSLKAGFYLNLLTSLASTFLLADKIGILKKFLKSGAPVAQSSATNPSLSPISSKKIATPPFITNISKKHVTISIAILCIALAGWGYMRFINVTSYNSFDYVTDFFGKVDATSFSKRQDFYRELQSKEHQVQLTDLYVYAVLKNEYPKKNEEVYSESAVRPKPLYTIYCAPTKTLDKDNVVAHCADFAGWTNGVPPYMHPPYQFETHRIGPVNKKSDLFGVSEFLIAINVYEEDLLKNFTLLPPVFVHESLYSLETLKELGLENVSKALEYDVRKNSASPKNFSNPLGNRSWITNFFTTNITVKVKHPDWITNEDGSDTFKPDDTPFQLFKSDGNDFTNFILFDLVEICESKEVISKQRTTFEKYYKMDYSNYFNSLATCLKAMSERENSWDYVNLKTGDKFGFENGFITGDASKNHDFRLKSPFYSWSSSPVGDPYFIGTDLPYYNANGSLVSTTAFKLPEIINFTKCFEQIAPINVNREDFVGVIENRKYQDGKGNFPLQNEKVTNLFFSALSIIKLNGGWYDSQIVDSFLSSGYSIFKGGKVERGVYSSEGQELVVVLDQNGDISEISGPFNKLFTVQKTAADAYVQITISDGRVFSYDLNTNTLINSEPIPAEVQPSAVQPS